MENNIEHILVRYPEGDRGFLIPILQEVQEHYGYIASDVVDEIAEFTRVPPGEIYGVASFYSQFRFAEPGEHTVQESLIVYRRSREEMPCREEETHHAVDEGVQLNLLLTPVAFHSDGNGWVKEMECLKNELGEPDASGRRRPVPIPGSNFRIPADVVVIAIGQSPNPLIPNTTSGLETGRRGNIIVDEQTMKTSKKGVFAGGDVATGGATVILAMGQAKIAAEAIDEYLKTGEW
jgi:NADPH-dependent glutamate synthase beta subunit-like oxidoreductase